MLKILGSLLFVPLMILHDWLQFKCRGRAIVEKEDDPVVTNPTDAWNQHYLDISKKK